MTPGQKERMDRNLVIAAAYEAGVPASAIAAVCRISEKRVIDLVNELRREVRGKISTPDFRDPARPKGHSPKGRRKFF
jgi:hypothetical protein